MSEWLGTGLQNRSHQFESGWDLQNKKHRKIAVLLVYGKDIDGRIRALRALRVLRVLR